MVLTAPDLARADMLTGGLLGRLVRGDEFTGPRFVDILVLGGVIFLLLRVLVGRSRKAGTDASRLPDSRPVDRPRPDLRPPADLGEDRDPGALQPPPPGKPDMYTMAQATWDALKSPDSRKSSGQPAATGPIGPAASPDEEFLAGAKMAYSRIIQSLAARDFNDLTAFVAPGFLAELKNRLPDAPAGRPDILLVEASLADSRQENGRTVMTVEYKALVREPGAAQNSERLERWRFTRDSASDKANWLLEAMERR
jgi:predicted lipid-binding transport protein (Tim44 family)